jgi:hypothetical protein
LEACWTLCTQEVRAFFESNDSVDAVSHQSTLEFPSQLVTVAHLLLLAARFGLPSATDIIARASGVVTTVHANFKKNIKKKLDVVKKAMTYINTITENSCGDYLSSPYCTTPGDLKRLIVYRYTSKKEENGVEEGMSLNVSINTLPSLPSL